MPFQFSDQGVPYHQPVGPELPPRPQPMQPDYIGSTIVNAFVHRAIASEQAQLEQKHILQTADLEAQRLAYQDKWQQEDHDIAQQNADSLAAYRKDTSENYLNNKAARDATAAAKLAKKQNEESFIHNYVQEVDTNDQRSTRDATGFFSQNEAVNNPGQVYINGTKLLAMYGQSKAGTTPGLMAQVKTHMDSLKTSWIPGVKLVTATGETVSPPTGHFSTRKPEDKVIPRIQATNGTWMPAEGAVPQPTKLSEIASAYQDPVNRPAIDLGFVAAGHGKMVKRPDPANPGHNIFVPKLDKFASRLTEAFKQPMPDVPSVVPQSVAQPQKQWLLKGGVGQPGGGGVEDDRDRANAAIEQNPQAEEAIRAYFEQKHGEPL